ncbi:hypothetical protein [Bacillus suaedaesalsae]|uniref:Glycoside-hydrolase family GH114 TIM-barrel domain-containing protein n=1 Tax=Bacillus suaedaesalsae TaxID=2810349 RepID=A0ABS2DDB0_9BACI|nr:hypothetical protein [Bacillus suaedaesalsae]MBM6616447.1 hypothetical protein [Bacillus suaedaesalsae]
MARSTWIWDVRVLENRQEAIVNQLKENQMDTVYIFYTKDLDQNMYKQFITLAHTEKIKVEALGGERVWGLEEHEQEGVNFVQSVIDYNEKVRQEEKFDAVHLDIEPYLLEQWEVNKTKVLENWYNNSLTYINLSKQNGLTINCDLPFWLDSEEVIKAQPKSFKKPLYELFIDAFDGVNLMSYRNTVEGENSITDISNTEMTYAKQVGGRIGIAIDLLPSDIGYTTFYDTNNEELEKSISELQDYYRDNSSYNGVAIHDFDHLIRKR